jgi:hypothetical protein
MVIVGNAAYAITIRLEETDTTSYNIYGMLTSSERSFLAPLRLHR